LGSGSWFLIAYPELVEGLDLGLAEMDRRCLFVYLPFYDFQIKFLSHRSGVFEVV
jgi:hypothetical protein